MFGVNSVIGVGLTRRLSFLMVRQNRRTFQTVSSPKTFVMSIQVLRFLNDFPLQGNLSRPGIA